MSPRLSSVIDVYDLRDQTYQYSFYLPDYDSKTMTDFWVFDGKIVAVLGQHLVMYLLNDKVAQGL
jgi:hypothetical protein